MRPYIANETQARKELARLKSIMIDLHSWIADAIAADDDIWVSIYEERLAGVRSDVKYIVSYLNA